jgi:hypothetical protein
VLLALPAWRSPAPADPAYHALGNTPLTTPATPGAPATGGAALVRFRPDATEADIRRALQRSGARLVDGPTATDAYLVRLPPERYAESLALLRGQPAVQLAEALEAAGTR